MTDPSLRHELMTHINAGGETLRDEATFNRLALRVFRQQVRANPIYGAFVRGRLDADTVDHWTRVPAVPARAFKEIPELSGASSSAQAVFLSSGTTAGAGKRSEHRVQDLELYRASALAWGRRHLHPNGEEGPGLRSGPHLESGALLRVLALLPSPDDRPDSSLARMAGFFAQEWGDERSGFFADSDFQVSRSDFVRALAQAAANGVPVLLLGTAFGFAHLLEDAEFTPPPLPAGSLIMETGGYKGRARERPRAELYAELSSRFGLPAARIVNEYGMTELLSQFYEPVLREGGPADVDGRRHLSPPWVRSRALHPESLEALEPGRPGLLAHFDLANLHSVSAILTEDLGVEVEDGFRVLGRNPGAEPRGCSLVLEEMLQ